MLGFRTSYQRPGVVVEDQIGLKQVILFLEKLLKRQSNFVEIVHSLVHHVDVEPSDGLMITPVDSGCIFRVELLDSRSERSRTIGEVSWTTACLQKSQHFVVEVFFT